MGLQRYNNNFRTKIISAMLILAFICQPRVLAEDGAKKSVFRNSVYKLKHITAENAKKTLIALKIGTHINQIGKMEALIITTNNPQDLKKAASIIGLIDSKQEFVVRTIIASADPQKLPKNEDIAAEIGDITIGTLQDPPSEKEKPQVIVDFHNSDLIAIGLQSSVDKIAKAVEKLTPSRMAKTREKPEIPAAQPAVKVVEKPAVTVETANGHDLQRQRRQAQLKKPASVPRPPAAAAEEQPSRQKNGDPFGEELLDAVTHAESDMAGKQQKTEKPPIPDDILRAMQKLRQDDRDKAKLPANAEVTKVQKIEKTQPSTETTDQVSNAELISAIKALTAEMAKLKETTTAPAPVKQTIQVTKPDDKMEIKAGEEELELSITLPEKVKITALLELVGKQLGLNYIYDPKDKDINSEIMLKIHDGKIKVKDTYKLLESVLKTKNLVMTRRGKLVTIVPKAKAMEYDPVLRQSNDDIQPGDVIVTTVLKLEHADTATAQKMLETMSMGLKFQSIPETDTLIVTAYAYRMERIEKLIKMIDVPGKPRLFRFRQLQYTQAVDIVPKVKALSEQLGSVSVSIVAKKAAVVAKPRPVRGKTPPVKAPPAPVVKGVYLDTDERTNRIFMIGLADELEIVNAMIDALDVPKTDLRFTRMYEVQNIGPDEAQQYLSQLGVTGQSKSSSSDRRSSVRTPTSKTKVPTGRSSNLSDSTITDDLPRVVVVEAINSLLIHANPQQHEEIAEILAYVDAKPDETATPYVVYRLENQEPEKLAGILDQVLNKRKKPSKGAAGSKVQTTAKPKEDDETIEIVPDESTRSLIIFASRKNQQLISSLIDQLDISRPQVLLDVTLVEITKDNEFNFDLDVVSKYPALIGGMQYGGIDVLMTPVAGLVAEGMSTEGTGKAFYADRHIQALLDIMDDKQYGRVLARPSLLVWDNEQGIIKSEKTIYIGSEKSSIIPGDRDTDPTITSDVSFDSYQSGITLTITPHITSETLLQLDIELDRKDFISGDKEVNIGTKTVPKPLDTVSSNVSTKAVIPNGATIILGGIETINQGKNITKIPILGDIPLVGALFRGANETDVQSKLYVFVKAHIIQPGDELTGYSDIERVSMKKRRSFEEAETKFQELRGTPGIEQTPLDPVKILEDDEYIDQLRAAAEPQAVNLPEAQL